MYQKTFAHFVLFGVCFKYSLKFFFLDLEKTYQHISQKLFAIHILLLLFRLEDSLRCPAQINQKIVSSIFVKNFLKFFCWS